MFTIILEGLDNVCSWFSCPVVYTATDLHPPHYATHANYKVVQAEVNDDLLEFWDSYLSNIW